MKVEDFYINGRSDLLPTELVCPVCFWGSTDASGATLGDLIAIAREHIAEKHASVIEGVAIASPLALARDAS